MRITSDGKLGLGTADIPSDTNLAVLGNYQSGFYRNVTSGNRGYIINLGAKTSTGFADGASITGAVESGDSTGYLYFGTRTGGSITEKARIDSDGRLLVGTSTTRNFASFGGTTKVCLEGIGYLNSSQSITNNETAADGGYLIFAKSRGTSLGSVTSVNDSDLLGSIWFQGADGTDLVLGAKIDAAVDGTPETNDMPTRLVFSTTADGASTPTEAMKIDSKQTTTLTSSSLTTATLVVKSNGASDFQRGITIDFDNRAPNDANSYFWAANDSVGTRGVFMSNGGLHNYSANNVNLSDRNAKKNIASAAGTWDCLKEWEIVNFHYKEQSDNADLNMGVIAQQIAESCPEVVTVFQDAREATETEPAQEERIGVKDQQMVWMAIKALQEAQLRIETLEAEVAALKGN
jgi:hypothetical protein